MQITAGLVKELREKTGAGMMDCKNALKDAEGDLEKAVEILRTKGIAKAEKRSGRDAKDGMVHAYIHPGSKLGVLIEVNCETDFVANTDDFKEFVNNVAMHVAATNPMALDRADIPAETIERETRLFRDEMLESGKPEHIIEKIVSGKIEKFYSENVLLEQGFIRDPEKTIKDYLTEVISKIGENITISRYQRFKIGE